MREIIFSISAFVILIAAAGGAQAPPSTTLLVNRMSGAYRSLQSFRDIAAIKRRAAGKEAPAELSIVMQKPNKYRIDLKGDHLNTAIASDGNLLTAMRPDKKVYTRRKAPSQIIRADLIGEVDMPSPGARIIAELLAGNAREGAMGQILLNGKVTGPEKLGSRRVYVLNLPYGEEQEARVYVGAEDYLIRQVKLLKGDEVQWLEEHGTVETDKPVDPEQFTLAPPEGFRLAASLPPLEQPVEVAAKEEPQKRGDTHSPARDSQSAQGRAVYQASGCGNCHAISGQGGRIGPNLTRIAAARTRERLISYVRNPRAINPNTRMPGFNGRISESDLQALGDFLSTLK